MTLDELIKVVAAEFEETPEEQFTADTIFKDMDEWGSLIALSIITTVEEEFDKSITGADLRACNTIKDLYDLIETR